MTNRRVGVLVAVIGIVGALAAVLVSVRSDQAGTDVVVGHPHVLPVRFGGSAGAEPALAPARPIEYVVDGTLPELNGAQRAWEVRPGVEGGRARIAAALGVPEGDIGLEPGGQWSYPPANADAVVSSTPGEPVERPAHLPSKDEARRIAVEAIAKTGVDVTGARVDVTDGGDAWLVSISPHVGGRPTSGWAWSVQVADEGRIQAAGGWVADAQVGDEYPLTGTTDAVKRLREGRAFPIGPQTQVAANVAPTPQRVAITGAEVGLAFAPAIDDAGAWLVPVYLLSTRAEDGTTGAVTVLAIAEQYVTPQGSEGSAPAGR